MLIQKNTNKRDALNGIPLFNSYLYVIHSDNRIIKNMSNFKVVHAEAFPQQIQWQYRDTFVLLLIPLIMLNGWLASLLFSQATQIALVDSIFRGGLFLVLCYLYKEMLIRHWQYFNRVSLKSWLLVIVGAIVLQGLISITRAFLPMHHSVNPIEEAPIDPQTIAFIPLLFISLGPIFTALIEDIVFRYTLLHKLFVPKIGIRIILVLLNSILFGLIHYHNFDGHLIATVSFMVAGLFLNVVYLWTRNIWHVLLIHVLNNAVLSLGAVILLKLFAL